MNYTSSRYDGPYGYNGSHSQSVPGGLSTHSASSSLSSDNEEASTNLAGVGALLSSTSSGQHARAFQRNFNGSGDFEQSNAAGDSAGSLPSASSLRMLPRSGISPVQFGSNHARRQPSDDYDYSNSSHPWQGYGANVAGMNQTGLNVDPDNSFDFLLSPALIPVGPISSSSSSLAAGPAPLAPPPNHPPPPLPSTSRYANAGVGPNLSINVSQRPAFGRSQTTGVAPTSARPYGTSQPLHIQQQQQPQQPTHAHKLSNEANNPLVNSSAAPSQVQGKDGQHGPPLAISAAALLDIVLRMRGGDGSSSVASSSSALMGRSVSASAVEQQSGMTHARNVSTGSNTSEGENQGQENTGSGQHANLLQPPSHPGMARTASSRNVGTAGQQGLGTVDLSHQRIADVPEEVIDVLAGTVERLALSYNYISTLPPAFTKLGNTLRYLNIRLNMLTSFPNVLCEMPSLEILDISRNKIKRLPTNCGTLKSLRVFSISKNRVKRLPAYFAEMDSLRVLKIDYNPIEWPPKEIVTQPAITAPSGKKEGEAVSKIDEAQALQKWLSNLQEWIKDHASEASTYVPALIPSASEDTIAPEGGRRNRSASEARDPSVPRLPNSASSSGSQAAAQDAATRLTNADLPPLDVDASRLSQHGRNASHSLASGAGPPKRSLRPKKSLPDLRQNHAQILDERFNDEEAGQTSFDDTTGSPKAPLTRNRPNGRHTKTSSNSSSASPVTARPIAQLPTPPRSASGDRLHALPSSSSTLSIPSADGATPRGDLQNSRLRRGFNAHMNGHDKQSTFERASGAYFRRLSMLPASTISKAVPDSLLQFIDSIRGILFALSQVYASLKQCVVFPSRDRLPQPLNKTMASADDAMGFLIDALDRFDSSTRRGTPDIAVVKDVIETCRENVSTFAKLVTVLSSNIPALFDEESDIRYTRTMVLALYGSMGEIGTSWAALTPVREEIIGWLRGESSSLPTLSPSPTGVKLQPPTPAHEEESPFGFGGISVSSPAFADSNANTVRGYPFQSPSASGQSPTGTPLTLGVNKQRPAPKAVSRRHAGSFTGYQPHLPGQ